MTVRARSIGLTSALVLATAAWLAIAGALLAEPVSLYVSTAGDDAWSGRLPEPNAQRADGPFRSLTRARDALRALRKTRQLAEGATVWVRGGAYYLTTTFQLSAVDSGTADGPILYRAYRDEEPILVGGAHVTGFVPHRGRILKADLRRCELAGVTFKQLFFNRKRQKLARFPNFRPDNPYAGGFLYVAGQPNQGSKTSFQAPPEAMRNWSKPEEGEVWGFPGRNYWNNILPIQSVEPQERIVTLAKPASYEFNPGDRFFFRGYLEELDAPGEWYLDKTTSTLYFWPPAEIKGARVSVPRVQNIVVISKQPNESEWPHHITFAGFVIEGCEARGVSLRSARDCAVIGCVVRNAGAGIVLSPGKDCLVYGNDVYETGNVAIAAYSGNRNPEQPDANRIENNYVHHTGYFTKSSCAITVTGVGNVVSHNLVHDCPRIAVVYNGNDHVIEYNHLRHMNLETQDSGATYSLGRDWTNRGHIVRYNYVHDTLGYGRHGGDRWHSPFFTFGIYLDDWSSGQHVYGNIVARSFLAGIDVHSGRDNVIENNVIYDCYREQFRYQPWPTSHLMLPDMLKKVQTWPFSGRYPGLARHRDPVADSTMSYNVFRRNIISYGRPGSRLYAVSGLDHKTTEHDFNLIWRWGAEPDASLAKMRENGLDTHSVIADPKFADPDHGDFTLAPDSPALALGFKPIPFHKIGLYQDPRRASWPIVEAEGAREHPHTMETIPRDRPTFRVARRNAPIGIDGILNPDEWGGLDRGRAILLAQEPSTATGAKPPSYAWITVDATSLYVGLLNELKPGSTVSGGHRWGGDDGAEVCLQRGDGRGPIFVLQGFADGHFQSTDHTDATLEAAEKLGSRCEFAAGTGENCWTGEWRIPLEPAGIDAAKVRKLRFNIGVRKTAGPRPWICWIGTGGANFHVESAGELLLTD